MLAEPKDASFMHPDSFAFIAHRDDIVPHVADNKAIRLFTNGRFDVLRYLVNDSEFFQNKWDIECRGLIFDAETGELLCRPFHKFFNLLRAEHMHTLLEEGPVRLANKLDGSMIFTCVYKGDLVFFTKGGETSHAKTASERAPASVHALARDCAARGKTPIFEWVSPDNRIVLAYDQEDFVLLAVRDIKTGAYEEALADELAERHGVSRPHLFGEILPDDAIDFWIRQISEHDSIEGVVAIAPNGNRLKLKAHSYLNIHRTLSMLSYEKHALRSVLMEIEDDVLPMLRPDQRAFYKDYTTRVSKRILDVVTEATDIAARYADLDGRAKAEAITRDVPKAQHMFVFQAAKGKLTAESVRAHFERTLSTQKMIDDNRTLHGFPQWAPPSDMFMQG